MENEIIILVMTAAFLVLAFLGVPVAFALLAGALLGAGLAGITFNSALLEMFNGVNSVPLLAIPFFILIAELMSSSGIATKIVKFVQTLVGHLRSGLAQVNALFSIFFAGISGSSNADVAASSRLLLPEMKKEGYPAAASAALIAAASTIANLIPPSIMAIIYGSAAGVSVAALFVGGVIPGLLVGLGLMIYSYFFVRGGKPSPRAPFREMRTRGLQSVLPLVVPVIIMVGILTGIFTPTEAGMVAVVYFLVVVIPAMARGHLRKLFQDFVNAAILYSIPLLAVSTASVFAWVFTYLGGARAVAELMERTAGDNSIAIMFTVVVAMIIVGQFIDAVPAIVIFAPIINALIGISDINPVHMGIVVIVCFALGLLTPPFGLALLLATSFARVSFWQGVKKAVPLYGLFLGIIALLVLVPDLALWLPQIFVPEAAGCFADPQGAGFVCP